MGRRSAATRARLDNLEKAQKSQQPTVEDVPEDENMKSNDEDLLEQGFFFADEGDEEYDSESDDEDGEEDELYALKNKAEINHFNAILFEAQALAVKAEREAAGQKPKRKRHYTGNSKHTLRYYSQKH